MYVRYLLKTADGTATGTAQILVNGEGQNMIIVIAGANGQLTPADVQAAEDVIAQAAVLMVRACMVVCSCCL
jgi:ribokinase